MAHAPRESLYVRVERLVKGRRSMMLFGVGLVVGVLRLVLYSIELHSFWPAAIAVAVAALGVAYARRQARQRDKAGMARRTLPVSSLPLPTPWRHLNEAVEGYRILTGETPAELGCITKSHTGQRVDAEVSFTATDAAGALRVVSPFGAPSNATQRYVFDEAMLDTYSSDELLAVMLHLRSRAEFARGESARLANGVRESDSKALLLMRDHLALLRAIEKSSRDRLTPVPSMGLIRFADNDVYAKRVSNAGIVRDWIVVDRVASLRIHLGAMGLDASAG